MTGAERFDHYVERVLYGDDGFYRSGRGVAGRRGDFITSPEVGPLFGAVLARWLDEVWDELGRPDPFVVVDAGTGPGTLLRSLVMAEPECGSVWQLHGVDVAFDDVRHGDGFSIGPTMPADLDGAVVIANELFDNVPFRWVEHTDGGMFEVFVDEGTRVLRPIDEPMPDVIAALQPGHSAPWLAAAAGWVADVLESGAARVLAFDYGLATTTALADRGGWLRTYQGHGRGSDPFAFPGQLDITTDIAVDQLPAGAVVRSQAEFLAAHGIDDLVDEGRAAWELARAKPDLAAFKMRSRINEADALLDMSGLGSWLAMEWRSPDDAGAKRR